MIRDGNANQTTGNLNAPLFKSKYHVLTSPITATSAEANSIIQQLGERLLGKKDQLKVATQDVMVDNMLQALSIVKKFDDPCAICMGDMHETRSRYCKNLEVQVLNCKHVFHRTCIQHWLSRQKRCPMCRAPTDL